MDITGLSLSEQVRERAAFVNKLTPADKDIAALCQNTVVDVGTALDPTAALNALHVLQRLYLAGKLGVLDDPKITEALKDPRFTTWKDYKQLSGSEENRNTLATRLYHGDPEKRKSVNFNTCDYGRGIAEKVLVEAVKNEAELCVGFDDPLFARRLFGVLNEEKAAEYADLLFEFYANTERSIVTRVTNSSFEAIDPAPDAAVEAAYVKRFNGHYAHTFQDRFYTLTLLPTEKDAAIDNIPYDEYVDLYFGMCGVDLEAMNVAHKVLIAKLNAGSILRFTNDDGTDVSMDIIRMTFANSLVAKNIPGSEVFSAPIKNSINGKIVAKGRFANKEKAGIIEDITLEFEDGYIVRYSAAKNEDVLREAIERDEGSRYIGEIGIGTNPVLRRHVVNGLMVEKIGGSFHVAVGSSYQMKEYMGVPVNLDNGNRSAVHWDITTMLFGRNGKMILDGETLYENDAWVDPRLAYLNGPQPK